MPFFRDEFDLPPVASRRTSDSRPDPLRSVRRPVRETRGLRQPRNWQLSRRRGRADLHFPRPARERAYCKKRRSSLVHERVAIANAVGGGLASRMHSLAHRPPGPPPGEVLPSVRTQHQYAPLQPDPTVNLHSSLRTLAFASVCVLHLPAGVLTFNFTETGGNVVVTASGNITDVSAWNTISSIGGPSFIYPSLGEIVVNPPGPPSFTVYSPTGPYTGTWTGGFGPPGGPATIATSSSGDPVAFRRATQQLLLPASYSIGTTSTPLSSTMTFTGATFTSLGITPGAYTAIYGRDTIQLTFGGGGGSSVPDAGPGPALALLLGGLGLRQWRSSRRSRAAA